VGEPLMFGWLACAESRPVHRVDEICSAIKQVFVRLSFPYKNAAFDMAMPAPNLSRGLNHHGISVTRLAMLPEQVRAEVWRALAPFFGVPVADADPEIIKRLEQEIEEQKRAREDVEQRLSDLEAIVRRLVPAQPEKERSCA
jgi:hypothetical protein